MSGALFVAVMDPVLRCLWESLRRRRARMARACADDLAVALRSARQACDLVPVFREADAVEGPRLHTTGSAKLLCSPMERRVGGGKKVAGPTV